jgi:16S rRNA G527 N7-methylase RsmG
VEQSFSSLVKALSHVLGADILPRQHDLLDEFAAWLEKEAVPAGGLGPSEVPRIRERHVFDSLLFARAWSLTSPPRSILDVGTGIGLPGIPLAILWPTSEVLLVDRSTTRVDLTSRAVRVLGLSNIRSKAADVREISSTADLVTARGVMPPQQLRPLLLNLLNPGGIAAVGGSRQARPSEEGYETVDVGARILDQAVWLLIMRSPWPIETPTS